MMTNKTWSSRQLHDELMAYYARFRGRTVPTNSFTESLWAQIEAVEFEEGIDLA